MFKSFKIIGSFSLIGYPKIKILTYTCPMVLEWLDLPRVNFINAGWKLSVFYSDNLIQLCLNLTPNFSATKSFSKNWPIAKHSTSNF